jgi:hypothetical protein
MCLLLGLGFPYGFGLSGVILPKEPPCFGIPFFEVIWFPHQFPTDVPRPVFIQDVCNSHIATFAQMELDGYVRTISAKHIKTLSVASGEYDISSDTSQDISSPVMLAGLERLYAFAESSQSVQIGHQIPLRERLARNRRVRKNVPAVSSNAESDGNHFTTLELARFQRDRLWCLETLRACFGSLQQHNRVLAANWLQMTKTTLKSEGILESTD